jgi:V/A-type H+-transporting ATPase subunit G/H
MKVFRAATLITVLFFLILNNVSAESFSLEKEQKAIEIDILTEGSAEEAEKLAQQVLEDMKNHPERVQLAFPLEKEQRVIEIDILTEGSEEESEKLAQQVLEDMREHPEKVQFALPLDEK